MNINMYEFSMSNDQKEIWKKEMPKTEWTQDMQSRMRDRIENRNSKATYSLSARNEDWHF